MLTAVAPKRDYRSGIRWGLGLAAVLFGFATLREGGQVLFGGSLARGEAGNIVLFVLVFNFSAGFFYVAAGLGAITRKRWAVSLSRILAVGTVLVFIAFGVHVALGRPYEVRTVVALTLRSAFWITQALVLSGLTAHHSQRTTR